MIVRLLLQLCLKVYIQTKRSIVSFQDRQQLYVWSSLIVHASQSTLRLKICMKILIRLFLQSFLISLELSKRIKLAIVSRQTVCLGSFKYTAQLDNNITSSSISRLTSNNSDLIILIPHIFQREEESETIFILIFIAIYSLFFPLIFFFNPRRKVFLLILK